MKGPVVLCQVHSRLIDYLGHLQTAATFLPQSKATASWSEGVYLGSGPHFFVARSQASKASHHETALQDVNSTRHDLQGEPPPVNSGQVQFAFEDPRVFY